MTGPSTDHAFTSLFLPPGRWLCSSTAALLFGAMVGCSSPPPAAAPAQAPSQPQPTTVAEVERVAPQPTGPAPTIEEIKQVISRENERLRQCYIAGTFKDSQLAGTVNVTFTISPLGQVEETVDGGSNLPDREVVSCVLDVFASLQFPPGGTGSMEITYPISFGRAG